MFAILFINKTMKKQTESRLQSLDVLRGLTIAGMILVNNPGDWNAIYAPLKHADWHGLTPTDLVFPFFMFILGISTYLSLRKTHFKFSTPILVKIVKRTSIIFLIGLGLSWFSLSINSSYWLEPDFLSTGARIWQSITHFEDLRIFGVMQRLAICYGLTAILGITVKHKYLPSLIATLLIGYFVLLLTGNGFEKGDSNIVAIVDQKVLGLSHIYNAYGLDPEGILSTIPSVAHVLIGFCLGKILMETKDNNQRMLLLFIYGAILTFTGLLLSYGCPINKKLWTPSFVLTTCGMAATLLSLLIWIIDVNKNTRWSVFFESFGVNPLFIYVFAYLLATLLDGIRVTKELSIKEWIYSGMLSIELNPYFTSTAYAVLFIIFCWSVVHVLYRKKIYIKI